MWLEISLILLHIFLILCYRLYRCLPFLSPKKNHGKSPIKVMAVLGSGGHTGEIAPLLDALSKSKNYRPFILISSSNDKLSQKHPLIPKENVSFETIPRARAVGQSFTSSIFTTFYSFAYSLKLMFLKPELLLVNGPGVCFPVVLSIFIGNVLSITNCSIVFVESVCRVESLSLTGKLIYPLCDLFFVHWPSLLPLKKRIQLIDIFSLHKNQS